MKATKAYGANSSTEALNSISINRRSVTEKDVEIKIEYCGVCHSDLHTARNEWEAFPTVYPCVPGHEIVGKVTSVGSKVSTFKVGDLAAVGCLVDSCGECGSCKDDLEQYCEAGKAVFTYNSEDPHKTAPVTYGGYSESIVVDESFVLSISDKLDLAATAPLLCAGITLYSPLKHWNAGPGKKVGIVGLGGLGHMGVKLSSALGAHTVLFTRTEGKVDDAKRLGAKEVVLSTKEEQMGAHSGSFDFIISTVSASHNLDPYISLLKRDGSLILVGAPEHAHPSPTVFNLLAGRKSLSGSMIGGIAETQEMLNFCAEKGIASDIELINIQDINKAYSRMLEGDVKYRFVVDMNSLQN